MRFAHDAHVMPAIGSSTCCIGPVPAAIGYFTSCVKATVWTRPSCWNCRNSR